MAPTILAVLLFAAGVQWLGQRRWAVGLLALPALPAWCLVVHGANTILANDLWWGIVGLQLQGIVPFGAS